MDVCFVIITNNFLKERFTRISPLMAKVSIHCGPLRAEFLLAARVTSHLCDHPICFLFLCPHFHDLLAKPYQQAPQIYSSSISY